MQISRTLLKTPQLCKEAPKVNSVSTEAVPTDSVTLGSNGSKEIAFGALAGAVPVLGAAVNYAALIGASVTGNEGLALGNLAGGVANLAGTASIAGGLILGSPTAVYVGLGMLGASATTAALTAASL